MGRCSYAWPPFHKFDDANEQYGFYAGSVGHLTSDIIHAVDALRRLAGGEVVAVAADNRSLGMPFANSHEALLRFETGCTAILTAHRRAGTRMHYFELHADRISAYAGDQRRATIYRDGDSKGLAISAAEAAGSDAWH